VREIPDQKAQTEAEIRNTVIGYLSRRGVRENPLIGKNVILSPPYSLEICHVGDVIRVTIKGDKSFFEVECAKAVVSEYRPNIDFVIFAQTGPPQIKRLTPLQQARLKLLDLVKPGSHMAAAEFYRASRKTGGETQVNARRRWGELRTEYGFETTYDDAAQVFKRGNALPINDPNPRPNNARLRAEHWDRVYQAHHGHCNKCDQKVQYVSSSEGDPGVIDHRRPIPFGGGDDKENLQLLCQVCNNLKGTVCHSCPINYQCEACTWAHPEEFHDAIVVRLTPQDAAELAGEARKRGKDPLRFAQELFASALGKYRRKE